jgi:hypothetical protein
MRIFLIVLFAIAVAGCASEVEKKYNYDPNEKIILGTIITKEAPGNPDGNDKENNVQLRKLLKGALEGAGEIISRITIAGGIATVIIIDALNQQSEGQPVAYTVRSTEDEVYIVISKHSGFSVGDCVDLFISTDLIRHPPRMAYGNSC